MYISNKLLSYIYIQVSLRILDVSQNRLTKLDNIGCLPCLETLNASKNLLENSESIQELALCSNLMTLDLSNNVLNSENDDILDVISSTPKLISFNLTGNPIMKTPQLRKKFICKMPKLTYLDRPIFAPERFAAEAWGKGGRDAEVNARSEYQKIQKEKAEQETRDFKEWKARKIFEQTKKQAQLRGDQEQVVITNENDENIQKEKDKNDNDDDIEIKEVNVGKMANKFWSSAATEIMVDKEGQERGEVSSFREPSFKPEAVDYEDMEKCIGNIKLQQQDSSNQKTTTTNLIEHVQSSSSLLPSPPVLSSNNDDHTISSSFLNTPPQPPLPTVVSSGEQETDFDQLD